MPPKKSSSKSKKVSKTGKKSVSKTSSKNKTMKKSSSKSKNAIKDNKLNNNINAELKKYNLKKVKSNIKTFLIITIIFQLIMIIFFSVMINYLNNLKSCECYLQNETKNANLTYLIIIEGIALTLQIISLVYIITLLVRLNKFEGGVFGQQGQLYAIIFLIIYFLVYGYFVYNIYLVAENVDFNNSNCSCAQNPIRYLLYAQGILTFVNLLMLAYVIIKNSIKY